MRKLFDNVLVQHEQPNWGAGGRLATGSTTTVLNLDRPVTLASGKSYRVVVHYDALQRGSGTVSAISGNRLTLSGYSGIENVDRIFVGAIEARITGFWGSGVYVDSTNGMPNGGAYQLWQTDALETRTVSNAPGTYSQVTVSSALPAAPAIYKNWMLGELAYVTQEWRIVAIDSDNSLTRKITCVNYDERIYDWNTPFVAPDYEWNNQIPHVTNLEGAVNYVMIGAMYRPVADLSWSAPADFAEYDGADIYVAVDDGPYVLAGIVRGGTTTFRYDAPNTPKVAITRGTVKACGTEVKDVAVGDVVQFSDSCGRPVDYDGHRYLFIRMDDVALIEG
jgi:co-chaperonin GroES (HSP10)